MWNTQQGKKHSMGNTQHVKQHYVCETHDQHVKHAIRMRNTVCQHVKHTISMWNLLLMVKHTTWQYWFVKQTMLVKKTINITISKFNCVIYANKIFHTWMSSRQLFRHWKQHSGTVWHSKEALLEDFKKTLKSLTFPPKSFSSNVVPWCWPWLPDWLLCIWLWICFLAP